MSDPAPIDQAIALHQRGELDRAAALYRQILETSPDDADAWHLLGLIAFQAGDDTGAIDLFRRALALDDRQANAHNHLGLALMRQQRFAEAAAHFTAALDCDADCVGARFNLADAYHALGDLTRARAAYEQALALDAGRATGWWGLGCLEAARGEHAVAAACLTRAVSLAPHWGEAHHNLGKSLFELGQIDMALDALRRATALLPGEDRSLGTIATIIPGSPLADHRAVTEARRAWAAVAAPDAGPSGRADRRPRSPARRLRVGYLSAFFAHVNWMKPVWGLINHHDRDRLDVHLFGDGPRPRVAHGYREDARDQFHDLTGLSTDDAARVIERADLDLLVDLNAYSRLARLPLLARRPAPVIVAWFNLFAPSGLPCVDYVIGDRHVVPADERSWYGERVVHIRGSYLTFEVAYPTPDVAPAPCLSRSHFTFGCLCPQYKITPQVVEAWTRILRASPNSRLFIKNTRLGSPGNRRFVSELFDAHGVGRDRLELEGPAPHDAFLAKYADVDVALDPFPYNGGTTTMEALWQGVPVLTFSGDRWASRIGASLMRSAGLPEFVAASLDDHLAQAMALAADPGTPQRLDTLRRTLRDRLRRSPVCDVRRIARDMERIYARMARR
jgi:protein O-GlcNAc transferase